MLYNVLVYLNRIFASRVAERLAYAFSLGVLEPRVEKVEYKHCQHLGVNIVLIADIPSEVLQVCLLQLVLFNFDRHTIHNTVALHK